MSFVTATPGRGLVRSTIALVTVELAFTVAGVGGAFAAVAVGNESWLLSALLGVDALAFAIVGAVIALARPANRVGWLMLAGGMLTSLGMAAVDVADRGLLHAPGTVPVPSAWAVAGPALRAVGWLLTTVAVPMIFPDGQLLCRRWRWLPWTLVAAIVAQLFGTTFASHAQLNELGRWHNPLSTDALNAAADPASGLGLLLAAVAAIGAIAQLVTRWRRGGAVTRQQIGMFAAAAALPIIAAPLSVAGLGGAWLFVATLLPLPFVVGFAVLARGLYDLTTAANRTLVWLTLSGAVVAIYAIVIAGVGSVLDRRGAAWLPWVAAAAVAISFAPLRDSLQRAVNRLMFGRWDNPYNVLAALGQKLEASADADRLLADVAAELETTLGLRHVVITDHQGTLLVGGHVDESGRLRLPLVAYGQPVGTLSYLPTTSPRPADVALLHDLAAHVAGLLYSHRLNSDLRTARERLVRAREEERRRLRRDLHDGLGPALAGHLLRLEVAVRDLDAGSTARRNLTLLRAEMHSTMSDVRRVVDGLRPPALDELGLLGALRQAVERMTVGTSITTRLVVDDVSGLSAAVEVAVFRIVTEAVTNVVSHAAACRCAVTVTECEGMLRVCIDDDGAGLPASCGGSGAGAGHGLDTMRERAEELGGTLTVRTLDGTSVRADIPLERTPT
jgi:signal transduction histidine kinase